MNNIKEEDENEQGSDKISHVSSSNSSTVKTNSKRSEFSTKNLQLELKILKPVLSFERKLRI